MVPVGCTRSSPHPTWPSTASPATRPTGYCRAPPPCSATSSSSWPTATSCSSLRAACPMEVSFWWRF
ncbi:hypothetical protein FH972_019606 [Carpinus fangiana]|uniref:Uncharacterized protein n=1 Tax=Carpinus fangiana TaxID=176857 RepID=A0A5N6RSV0_9ROSI|nr:hypothetical protein FH972_019606 [Carpinus fangiana]